MDNIKNTRLVDLVNEILDDSGDSIPENHVTSRISEGFSKAKLQRSLNSRIFQDTSKETLTESF